MLLQSTFSWLAKEQCIWTKQQHEKQILYHNCKQEKKKKKEGEEGKGWNHQMLKVYMNKYLTWKLQVHNNITQMQF